MPRHGALSDFLDQVRATPKARDAIAAGKIIEGTSFGVTLPRQAGEYFDDLAKYFERIECDEVPLIVELHDELVRIVRSSAPFKERFTAILGCLKRYDPSFYAQ